MSPRLSGAPVRHPAAAAAGGVVVVGGGGGVGGGQREQLRNRASSLKSDDFASLSFRKRLVVGDEPKPLIELDGEEQHQETDLVEAWLDDMLDEERTQDTAAAAAAATTRGGRVDKPRGLFSKGLDRATLSKAGMEKDAIDRLYRGLYSHSIEFQRLVSRETASAPRVGPTQVQGAHDALSLLNAQLSQASLGRAPEVEVIDAAHLDGERGVADHAKAQDNEEEMRMLLENKAEIEIRMQTLMANIAGERRKRHATEQDLREAHVQILAERGLCDREKMAHAATRLRMEENQEEADKMKDWLNSTINNERMSVAKEKQNVERLNSRIGQLELECNNLHKAIDRANGEVSMAKGEIGQLRIVEAKLEEAVAGKDKDIMILKSNFHADMVECERQKTVYDDIVAQMQAAKKMYDEVTTTNAKLQTVIDGHVANISALESTRDELESTRTRLNADVEALKSDVAAKAEYIVDLEEKADLLVLTRNRMEEIQTMRSKLAAELESTRENAKKMEGNLRDQLFTTRKDLETTTAERDELAAAAEKAKREWQMSEEREDALEDDVEGQKVVRKKAMDRRDVAIDGMARAQVAVEDLERQLKNIKAERDKLIEINRNLDEDLKTAKDKAKNKEQQFKDTDRMLKETVEKAKKDSTAAEAKIKKLEGDLALERKKVQDLLPDVEKYKALKKEYAALDAEHKKLHKERDAIDVRLQQAEKERIKASNDRAAAVRDKAETNAKLKIANGDIDRLSKSKKALEDRVDVLEKRLLSNEEELEDTKARLEVSTQQCSRLEANLKQEEEEHAATRGKLEDVESHLLECTSKNEDLTQRVAALEEELGLHTNASGAKGLMLRSSMEAFRRERDELAEMNKNLKQQLEKLWAEIDKEMRDKSEIAEKMMRIQEEFQLAASMLDKESEAHAMTAKAQEEAEAKLRVEMEAAEAAAEAARKKREEDAATAAKKHNQTQSILKMQRAADKERRRRDAEAAQRELDEMSAEAQRKMIEEQLRMISGLEQELGKAGEEALKAEEVTVRLTRLHETVKEREREMLKLRATIEALELQIKVNNSARDAERAGLEDRIQSEATARRVRERYAEDLSKKLKLAKLEIIKLGRKPKTYSKETQTTYAELWVRNFLDEDDVAERRSGWVPKAVLARMNKKKTNKQQHPSSASSAAVVVSAAGAAATRNTIVTILSEKVKADMAAVREGKVPMQLPQFTYSYFFTRYGLPAQTEERLLEFAEAVHKHRGVPDVARFGLSCGLLSEEEEEDVGGQKSWHPPGGGGGGAVVSAGGASGAAGALAGFATSAGLGDVVTVAAGGRVTTRSVGTGDADFCGFGGGFGGGCSPSTLRASVPTDVNRVLIRGRTQRTATVDEVIAIRNVGDAGMPAVEGAFSSGLQLAPGDSNLLGVDTRHLNHALALDLAELQTKVVPTEIKHELLMHPLAEEAAEALGSAVGMDSILGYVADRSFADAMAGVDLGIMVSEEQLPQLHLLLIEACHILHMSCPLMYVKHHPTPAVYPWGVHGLRPSLVVTSAAIEVLAPRELQAAMAGAVAHLLPGSAPVEVTAHSVMSLAPELFLSREGVRPVWPSVIRPALDRWGRFAELSADRAALVVAQDVGVVVSAIMKMAAGSPSLNGQLNVHAVLDRARQIDQDHMARLPQLLRQADPGHLIGAWSSLAVLRAREVIRFQQSEGYEAMLASGGPASRPNSTFQRRKDLMGLAYMDVLPTLPLGLNLLKTQELNVSAAAEVKALRIIEGTPPAFKGPTDRPTGGTDWKRKTTSGTTTSETTTSGTVMMSPRPPAKGGPGGQGAVGAGPGGAAPRSTRLTPADGPGPGRPGR